MEAFGGIGGSSGTRPRAGRGRRGAPFAGWLAGVALACGLAPAVVAAAVPAAGGAEETPTVEVSNVEALAETRPRNPDPWEPFNRVIFQLNEWGDIFIVRPVAEGWRFMTPGFFRTGVTNFNDNLQMPVILGNNVLQLKPVHVRDDFLRIVFNMTFGVAGLLDVGTAVDIPQNDEDFGQTLGYWGTPSGPYLVLPVFGPSTVRDGIGRLADSAATLYFSFLPFYSTLLVSGVEVVNLRSGYIEEIDANRAESFDYYVFLRNAYLQNRRAKVDSRTERGREDERDEDLYHFEDEYELEDDEYDEEYDEDLDEDFDDDVEPAGEADAAVRIDAWRVAA